MSAGSPDIAESLGACESWVVLATGTFITCCRSRNFSAVDLLRQPVVTHGRIAQGIAEVVTPRWFPMREAVFQSSDGALYCRWSDLAVPKNTQPIDGESQRVTIDMRRVTTTSGTFSLVYFPWFRFLAEPVNFDAVGRVASYVGDCLLFLMKKHGLAPELSGAGNSCRLTSRIGLEIEITGQNRLDRLSISSPQAETVFDLARHVIEIDRHMFPAAFQAASQIVTAGDRLENVAITPSASRIALTFAPELAPGAAHV